MTIKQWRDSTAFTQDEIAGFFEISRVLYREIEQGLRHPSTAMLDYLPPRVLESQAVWREAERAKSVEYLNENTHNALDAPERIVHHPLEIISNILGAKSKYELAQHLKVRPRAAEDSFRLCRLSAEVDVALTDYIYRDKLITALSSYKERTEVK